MVGFGQAAAVSGGGAGAPGMRRTAAKSAFTRFGGSGEYPSGAASFWPAQAM